MAVKTKIAKSKLGRSKIQNKNVKQSTIKKSVKKKKNESKLQRITKNQLENAASDSDGGEDMLEMVDKDDLDFLKSAISNKSYKLLNRVQYTKPKKTKADKQESTLEDEYEETMEEPISIRNLLPIKTKRGLIPRQMVEESVESDDEEMVSAPENEETEEEYRLIQGGTDFTQPISAAQLLAARNEVLRQKKIHIGTLSSGVLENPEEKVTNLRTLLEIMDENFPEVYLTIRKLAMVSLREIFKDVLPSYEIKHVNTEGVKLKKDTLKLQRFEDSLLGYYKKYLKKLESQCFLLIKKKGNDKSYSEDELKLGILAIESMCELLETHPHFNFSQNIVQVVVPFLNNPKSDIRQIVKKTIITVFKEDKKEEISLRILRCLNQHLKTHSHNVHIEMLEILLVLNLKDVNLDQDKEQDVKNKKLNSKKQKILQMSKKEKKRKKKLQRLEKEMLETKAEENKQKKQENLTEITKIVFGIYFRILKSSTNTKILGVCLEGLAKFAHCINIEYFIDLINVLDKLLKEDWLGYRERLHCIQTVFTILSGQGEALNLDPTRFYTHLYKELLTTHAGRHHENSLIVLKTLNEGLIRRRKKITTRRLISYVKRIATLSLQLLHNSTLANLSIIKSLMQVNQFVDVLLDMDSGVGEGLFQPELDEPEYANASSTALYEMAALSNHYHPIVRQYAKNIVHNVPISGEGSLSNEYSKCTPEQLYNNFDMAEMAFNPAIPVPTHKTPSTAVKRINFIDNAFESYCKNLLKKSGNKGGIFI